MKNISKKRSTPSSNKKYLLIIGALVLVVAITSFLLLEKNSITNLMQKNDTNKVNTEEATKNDPTTGSKTDVPTVNGVDTNQSTDNVPVATDMSVSISSLQQSSGTVTITTAITGAAKEGVCTFTFTKDGAKPVVRSITTTTSSCTQTIPEQEFEMVGLWKVDARYFANSKQAQDTSEITIQ